MRSDALRLGGRYRSGLESWGAGVSTISISLVQPRRSGIFRLSIGLLCALLIVTTFALNPEPAHAAPAEIPLSSDGMPRKAYFKETGHHLSGDFLRHWLTNGDFTIYGFPVTDPIVEDGRIVQYFERARLELWPEHAGSEWVVQGTLLGRWKADRLSGSAPFRPVNTDQDDLNDDVYYFPETRHTLANAFKRYWDENGGVHVFGFPISEEFEENGFTVQYFERARFEWHPENAGTPYEILLGHLGKEYAEASGVSFEPIGRAGDAVDYDAGVFAPDWINAMRNGQRARWAVVETDVLNVRAEPSQDSGVIDTVFNKRPLKLERMVRGAPEKGIDAWYQLAGGGYVPAVYVDPFIVPAPPETFAGHWVDVNLTRFYAIAYENSTPVHAAIITAGRDDRTPKGTFQVQYRVLNETMDSATVGIPEGHPEYYYLEDVKYTQYFLAGGYALHSNYWTPEANFGRFSSNGCVGLLESDAEFFWNWLSVGSTVTIHF